MSIARGINLNLMRCRHALVLSSVLGVLALTSCSSQSDNVTQEQLTITGSSTVAPLMAEIAKKYEQTHPDVRIDVQTGGSTRGITDARAGVAQIGMVSRALKPDESDLTAHTIALDGISMIIHRDNPIKSLTDQQIKDVYTGKITNWKQVGGEDKPIQVVNKAEGRSTLELFTSYFELENSDIQADVVIGDNQQGIKTVAANPTAIGYVSIGTAEFEVENNTPIRLLPISGIEASTDNVKNSLFPLSRPLNLVTKGEVTPAVQELIDFAQAAENKDLTIAQFFVPVAE